LPGGKQEERDLVTLCGEPAFNLSDIYEARLKGHGDRTVRRQLKKTFEAIRGSLPEGTKIDVALLAGNASKLPIVEELLNEVLNPALVIKPPDPKLCVARGAAWYAAAAKGHLAHVDNRALTQFRAKGKCQANIFETWYPHPDFCLFRIGQDLSSINSRRIRSNPTLQALAQEKWKVSLYVDPKTGDELEELATFSSQEVSEEDRCRIRKARENLRLEAWVLYEEEDSQPKFTLVLSSPDFKEPIRVPANTENIKVEYLR
jgi:hypothetical protein